MKDKKINYDIKTRLHYKPKLVNFQSPSGNIKTIYKRQCQSLI